MLFIPSWRHSWSLIKTAFARALRLGIYYFSVPISSENAIFCPTNSFPFIWHQELDRQEDPELLDLVLVRVCWSHLQASHRVEYRNP